MPGFVSVTLFLVTAATLAGCGLSGGVGSLLVDPALYDVYRCKDLVTESHNLAAREVALRNLIDKASTGGGGSVIGALAYRSDYETVLAQEKLLKRKAADIQCQLAPTSSADRVIY